MALSSINLPGIAVEHLLKSKSIFDAKYILKIQSHR